MLLGIKRFLKVVYLTVKNQKQSIQNHTTTLYSQCITLW